MKVLIVGSSGLIGSALVPYLQKQGFEVGRLLRHVQDEHPYWSTNPVSFHLKDFSQPDIIINLAGKSIADGRWTEKIKQEAVIVYGLLIGSFVRMPTM